MRTVFLGSIAGAALIASGGFAAAQLESSLGLATAAHRAAAWYQLGPFGDQSQIYAEPRQGTGLSLAMGERGHQQGIQERRSVASVNLSSDQKTKLHDIVSSGNLHRMDHANFALSVGTRIPRTVRVYSVPKSIVGVVPQYRGFNYIIVGNDLLIIDPNTLEIVFVLPV